MVPLASLKKQRKARVLVTGTSMLGAAAATFAFSDEELLDVLTTFDDGVALALDKTAPPPPARFLTTDVDFNALYAATNGDASSAMPQIKELTIDLDETASTTSSSEQSVAVEGESVQPDGAKPSRKRRKHELDAMRALAASLENQLAGLKRKHHHEQPGTNLFWKRVADQLMLDRQRATTENARLRDIFSDQAKVVKAVQRSLQKCPDLEKLGVTSAPETPLGAFGPPDIYNRLFEDVEQAYRGTESIFQKAGINQAAADSRRVSMDQRTEDGRSVMCMEVAESRVLPFDASSVGNGVWQFLADSSCTSDDNDAFKRAFKARGDGVFGVCKVNCSLGLYALSADVAIRRFSEGSRITYVWECLGRCESDPSPANSFRLQEKGWAVFEPSPSDPEKKSIFRTCVQMVPRPMSPSQDLGVGAKDLGLLTELALSVYEKTIGCIYESVVAELSGGPVPCSSVT